MTPTRSEGVTEIGKGIEVDLVSDLHGTDHGNVMHTEKGTEIAVLKDQDPGSEKESGIRNESATETGTGRGIAGTENGNEREVIVRGEIETETERGLTEWTETGIEKGTENGIGIVIETGETEIEMISIDLEKGGATRRMIVTSGKIPAEVGPLVRKLGSTTAVRTISLSQMTHSHHTARLRVQFVTRLMTVRC